jgi:hypothetical protein
VAPVAVPPPAGLAPPEVEPPVPPLAGLVAPEGVVAPDEAGVVVLGATAVLVLEVVVVVVLALATVALGALPPVGTVSCGAPAVSVVPEPPPPHAASPTERANPATSTAISETIRRIGGEPALRAERFHAPATVRAVVEILLGELFTPVAETEILDGPRQLGCGRGQRQQLSNHL